MDQKVVQKVVQKVTTTESSLYYRDLLKNEVFFLKIPIVWQYKWGPAGATPVLGPQNDLKWLQNVRKIPIVRYRFGSVFKRSL